jgi:hypothetical protein
MGRNQSQIATPSSHSLTKIDMSEEFLGKALVVEACKTLRIN